MPVLGTTCFPTGAEIFGLVRGMLNDADIPAIVPITPTGASRIGTITTITTPVAHGLQIGNIVQVQSVSDSSFAGTQIVASVPTPTTFTYVQPGLPNASSGNGIVSIVVQGDWAIDAVLLPLVNKAYRKVQARLQKNGSPSSTSEVLITGFPVGATQLLDTTNPQLPVDFLAPRQLRERISGQPFFNDWMPRVDTLPSVQQGQLNGVYAWYEDGLYFVGATSATDLDLRYFVAFPDISGPDGFFTIRGCQDAIASHTAYLATQSRNPQTAAVFKGQFEEDMEELLNMQAHARQYRTGRRQPNNAGRRGMNFGWGYQR